MKKRKQSLPKWKYDFSWKLLKLLIYFFCENISFSLNEKDYFLAYIFGSYAVWIFAL